MWLMDILVYLLYPYSVIALQSFLLYLAPTGLFPTIKMFVNSSIYHHKVFNLNIVACFSISLRKGRKKLEFQTQKGSTFVYFESEWRIQFWTDLTVATLEALVARLADTLLWTSANVTDFSATEKILRW